MVSPEKKVLILEDDRIIQMDFARRIQSLGYIPYTASNLEEFIEKNSLIKPDAIMLDNNFPFYSTTTNTTNDIGLNLALYYRKINHNIPIAMITASNLNYMQNTFDQENINYFHKPIKKLKLIEFLNTIKSEEYHISELELLCLKKIYLK